MYNLSIYRIWYGVATFLQYKHTNDSEHLLLKRFVFQDPTMHILSLVNEFTCYLVNNLFRTVSLLVKISNIRILGLPSKYENIVTDKGLNDWSSFVIYIFIAIISFFFQ